MRHGAPPICVTEAFRSAARQGTGKRTKLTASTRLSTTMGRARPFVWSSHHLSSTWWRTERRVSGRGAARALAPTGRSTKSGITTTGAPPCFAQCTAALTMPHRVHRSCPMHSPLYTTSELCACMIQMRLDRVRQWRCRYVWIQQSRRQRCASHVRRWQQRSALGHE